MRNKWNEYKNEIACIVNPLVDKNIIIFGCNRSAFVLKTFLNENYDKEIKAIIDLYERLPSSTILHLYSFFYLYDKDDVIINVTEKNIVDEVEKTGVNWKDIPYSEEQVIDILPLIY